MKNRWINSHKKYKDYRKVTNAKLNRLLKNTKLKYKKWKSNYNKKLTNYNKLRQVNKINLRKHPAQSNKNKK